MNAILVDIRHPRVPAQPPVEPRDGLLGELIGAPELRDLAMPGLALLIAEALDEPEVGSTLGAGGPYEHGSALYAPRHGPNTFRSIALAHQGVRRSENLSSYFH